MACHENLSHTWDRLGGLAVNTSCSDQWREVNSLTGLLPTKHPVTLIEGVSDGQFARMKSAGAHLPRRSSGRTIRAVCLLPVQPVSRADYTRKPHCNIRLLKSMAKP